MPVKTKSPVRKAKKIPPPGRKLSKKEARDHVFKKYRDAMALLAKH